MKKKELEKIIQDLQDKNLWVTRQLEAERIKNFTLQKKLEEVNQKWLQASKDYEGIRAKYESLVKDTLREKPNKFAVSIPSVYYDIGKEYNLFFLISRAVRRIDDCDIEVHIQRVSLMTDMVKEFHFDTELKMKLGNYEYFSVVKDARPLDMVSVEITNDLSIIGRSTSGVITSYGVTGEIVCTRKTGGNTYETDGCRKEEE